MTTPAFTRLVSLAALLATTPAWATTTFQPPTPTETWNYTDCANSDEVSAHADSSRLWIKRGSKGELEATWQTTLLQGYDEMFPTDASGAVVPNAKPIPDSSPVSASWKLLLKGDATPANAKTFTSIGYPLIGSDFSALPGVVRYFDSQKSEDRVIALAQEMSPGKVWVSLYSSSAMLRLELKLDHSNQISTNVITRMCGKYSVELLEKVDLKGLKALLAQLPSGFGDVEPTPSQQ